VSAIVDPSPTGVFVLGMYESGVEIIGEQLQILGLESVVTPTAKSLDASDPGDELTRFNDRLLVELGGSWSKPTLLPQIELLSRLEHWREEARRVFRAAYPAVLEGGKSPWVWADPRNTTLAPFWIDALDVRPSVVLVHRHPSVVAATLSLESELTSDESLVLWDEYNRMGLHLWEELTGVIVGVEGFENDVKDGVRGLKTYLDSLGRPPSDEQVVMAVESFRGPGSRRSDSALIEVPNKFVVLDRVLTQADLTTSVDPESMVKEFANYYDEEYYTHYGNEGDAPYRPREEQWTSFFATVADRIVEDLGPETVLDAGCAIGFLVEALRNRGVDAWGIDISEWAISQVPDSIRAYCSVSSLTEEITGHFDLITIIEVIEHMPDAVAGSVIANLTRHADAVLFSSTPDGFEEATHINVRTPDHWAALFSANSFYRDFDYDASYLSKDAVLFRRSSPDTGALVVSYEQSLWSTRTSLQGILDEVVPERDALVSAIGDYAHRAGLAEHANQVHEARINDLGAMLDELDQRRVAEAVSFQDEFLRRDHETAGLHQELHRARSGAEAWEAQVRAIEATKVFRYSVGLRRLYARLRGRQPSSVSASTEIVLADPTDGRVSFAEWTTRYDTLDDNDRKGIRSRIHEIADPPLISVVLPVYNTPETFLREAIESVTRQLYPHWELCIADDCSTDPRVSEIIGDYAALDDRIKVVHRAVNGHISAASNSALEVATGRWVAMLDHDDRLREHALALVAIEADIHPEARLIYSDENIIDANGQRLRDYFKPDFDPLLQLGMNHICHLAVYWRELVGQVGGFREGFEGSQDWDLLLRATESLEREQVRHITHILYDWRSHPASTAQSLAAKPYAAEAGRRAVAEHLARSGERAEVVSIPALGWNRIRWEVPDPPPLVTIIIPTRDGRWLERCLRSIWTHTTYANYEILVVDNGSVSNKTLELLRIHDGQLKVLRDDRPFSYAGLNNAAVGRAGGSLLCLLNDDTEVITPDWLDEMVGHVLRPGVGAVGAKLYYENGTVQHAGVVLGIGGVGGHVHRGLDRSDIGYFGRAACAQHLSAVTGACMLVRREAWDQVGGLDDDHLSIGYNDVDFCLRLGEAGWSTVWTPFAELTHHESVSRGPDVEGANADRLSREGKYMKERWGMLLRSDPAYNPNLTLTYEDFSLAYPPRVERIGRERPH
jgi:GT2 family glycosyltransferase/2-polyprenyl-3-methyl-5-hydroxy-6-metoxy-1,4-benzoquinol methylase